MAARQLVIGGVRIRRGELRDIHLKVSENYAGDPVAVPIRVLRARRPGPMLFVTAAAHGDEINGTGIVHAVMCDPELVPRRGTLILLPVLNIFGLETQQRYMPDRRDLNRHFPGSPRGSMSSRVAHVVFEEVVRHCDFGLDLHAAAQPRVNYPNVRGELQVPELERLARAFGCELVLESKGVKGTLRREATRAGVPTLLFEGGEPNKIEPGVQEVGRLGVRNLMRELGMLPGVPERPPVQLKLRRAIWVRAQVGGLLRFHVAPGQPVQAGQPIATNMSLFAEEQNVLLAPKAGVVLGMTTLPMVKPGEPVCHIAISRRAGRLASKKARRIGTPGRLFHQVRRHLASSIAVSEREAEIVETKGED